MEEESGARETQGEGGEYSRPHPIKRYLAKKAAAKKELSMHPFPYRP